jgi:sugar O-acyltransferase (sialic acid O-acetyltransferase NeuD family)
MSEELEIASNHKGTLRARTPLILIGSGGHARAVADVAEAIDCYQIVGLIDSFRPPGDISFGYQILGGETELHELYKCFEYAEVLVAIGDNFRRSAMMARVRAVIPDVNFATLIHPTAFLGSDVRLGEGSVLMPRALVMCGSTVGRGCVLNTGSSLDHDSSMEDGAALAPGAITGGGVRIGERTFVGLGARIIEKINVGSDAVVGAGSLVLHDLPDHVLAYGVPCRDVRRRSPNESYLR